MGTFCHGIAALALTGTMATMLVGAVTFADAAEVTRPVGGVKVTFPILDGHCLTEDSNPRDAIFINRMSTLLRNANSRLIVLSMDCDRQRTWRNGDEGNIYDYSSYYIPMAHETQTLKGSKGTLRKGLCNSMRKQGDATLAIKDSVAKAAEELNTNAAVNSTKMIGVVGEDQHACYSVLLVGVRTADNENIVMSAFIIATVVRGKPIFSAIYHEYKGPETTRGSLEEAKSLAAVFDARNP
jgi:hypothetical protein